MRYASVCSGVEAASLAWMPLGWEPVWFSEIEPFPCEVLKQRFPGVQNLGDMTKIDGEKYRGTVDLLVGGTPCQGFSVAGKQGGLDDPRSALCLSYCRILKDMRPRWFVWENVPGVFSANGGEDFKAFLRKIDEIGYSCAWRVLDAQYIRVDGYPRAVPQRRRRVFVVGYLGEWRYPAEVLFEPGCLHRDSPPRREAGTGVARSVTASTGGASGKEQQHTFVGAGGKPLNALGIDGYNGAISGSVSATVDTRCKNVNGPTLVYVSDVADCLQTTCNDYSRADGFNMIGQGQPIAFRWAASPSQGLSVGVDYCHTLMANRNGEPAVCYENHAQDSRIKEIDCSPVLSAKAGTGGSNLPLVASFMSGSNQVPDVLQSATVRRLTPRECERLMGFPDDWTRIPWRGKPAEECPDSPRYKACGNSMCVNVMRWIGMRIENVERKMR